MPGEIEADVFHAVIELVDKLASQLVEAAAKVAEHNMAMLAELMRSRQLELTSTTGGDLETVVDDLPQRLEFQIQFQARWSLKIYINMDSTNLLLGAAIDKENGGERITEQVTTGKGITEQVAQKWRLEKESGGVPAKIVAPQDDTDQLWRYQPH
ncbi:hypothetical protein FIBSPDRAFT_901838 [Athelia psychrophila]|uniref:Uncharacterized protein n=1 Tax=Athelia psychrophila TaxID=1759441 RepID=A0A165WK71_9AGAM|nr:hypothetical protein FIBSPDRAFT_901838 [Fibularhizoctonia sp. CBS 109695]